MKTLFFCLALTLLIARADARLGETRDQIRARYGDAIQEEGYLLGNKVLKVPGGVAIHKKAGVYVEVTYKDGKAIKIRYRNFDGFSHEEFWILARGNGTKWEKEPTVRHPEGRTALYRSSTGNILTAYEIGGRVVTLDFWAPAYSEILVRREAARARTKRESAEKRLSGF